MSVIKKKRFELSSKSNALSPYTFLGISIFSFFSLLSFQDLDPSTYQNLFGRLGHLFSYALYLLFGRAAFVLPILCALFGVISFWRKNADISNFLFSIPVIILAISVFASVFETNITSLKDGGGFVGLKFSFALEFIFGSSGRFILSLAIFIFGVLLFMREVPTELNQEYFQKMYKEVLDKYPIKEKLDTYIQSFKAKEDKVEEVKNDFIPHFEKEKRKTQYVQDFSTVDKVEDAELKPFNQELYKKFDKDEIYKEEINLSEIPKFHKTSPEIVSKIHKKNFEPDITSTNINTFISSSPEKEIFINKVEDIEEEPFFDAVPIIEEPTHSLTDVFSEGLSEEDEVIKPNESEESDKDLFGNKISEDKKSQQSIAAKTSTVPDIIPKKTTEYYITHKVLSKKSEKKSDPLFKLEVEHTGKKIEEIIKEYGYESRVTSYQKGPIITRFELTPPPGVKLGRITSLTDELKLNLAVKSIRMVAPIPGKSSIGIEVPNKLREDVFLSDILRENPSLTLNKELTIVIGKDSITGESIFIDLNKLPHLLIAGTTGSGKSVSMNSMISSLLFTKSPMDVRFVMIDPKMVELALYEDIPHLLFPVITDPRKATKALAWAVQEMEIRYRAVSELKCRDLKSYNEKVALGLKFAKKKYRHLPYIIIFIDELSDLMMVSGKELEDYITRISQKSRAVGIHLVMATQRPSVDVITGLIKANCPARIAFHVAQKTDSKIILDYNGADALLGKGDFLYKSPTSPDLQRIQAPYISEEEIEKIVDTARSFADPEYVDISLDEESYTEEVDNDDEEYFEEAWNIVRTERKASASYLQRRMRIGYNKAARLMELMEERGYVGPQIGSKPRDILR